MKYIMKIKQIKSIRKHKKKKRIAFRTLMSWSYKKDIYFMPSFNKKKQTNEIIFKLGDL